MCLYAYNTDGDLGALQSKHHVMLISDIILHMVRLYLHIATVYLLLRVRQEGLGFKCFWSTCQLLFTHDREGFKCLIFYFKSPLFTCQFVTIKLSKFQNLN